MLKLMADPTGRDYFDRPLWQVSDADVVRYHVLVDVARSTYAGAHTPKG